MSQLSKLIVARETPSSVTNAVRTAVAATISYLVARLCRLPEAYWAPIATLIVVQSTLDDALPISVQRFAGTAIGAAVGAVAATYSPGSFWVFGAAVFLIELICALLRVDRSAYRYASITVAIVVLVPRSNSGSLIALHRFFEVSLGIAVGLVLSAVWPGRPSSSKPDPSETTH